MAQKKSLTIIGAGLTGLTLAYLLRDSEFKIQVFESRNRAGGRIFTSISPDGTPLEMGATWFGSKHQNFVWLLKELGVEAKEQEMGNKAHYEAISTSPPMLVELPPNPDPTFKLKTGTDEIIKALLLKLDSDLLHLNEAVLAIEDKADELKVRTSKREFESKIVVSTLPPNLLASKLDFTPSLPEEIENVCKATHTWMGESIKIGLSFERPFWRESGQSGTVVSNCGPIPEIYDHSEEALGKYGLIGFFNSAYASKSRAERLEMALTQLRKYYGDKVDNYSHYEEVVWSSDSNTYVCYEQDLFPHFNNGNPIFAKPVLDGKLFIAGSETAPSFPGYMDGAVGSAMRIAKDLLEKI